MADNVEADPGTGGATFATDDIGGVHYPRSKVVWGPDGTANDTDDASGKRLPVKIAELGSVTLAVSNAGTFATQITGDALTALQLIDDIVLTDDAAFTPGSGKGVAIMGMADMTGPDSVDEGDIGAVRMTLARELLVSVRDAAGNNRGLNVDASGNIGVTDAGASLTVDNAGTFAVQDSPATSGGLAVSRVIDFSGANQGQTSIKASAGQVYGWTITNTNAAARYVKIYNTASPTSASTPVLTILVPGNTAGAGIAQHTGPGIAFGTAIGMRATTGVADNDANAVASGEVIANVYYK